jgi:hypothetical protein
MYLPGTTRVAYNIWPSANDKTAQPKTGAFTFDELGIGGIEVGTDNAAAIRAIMFDATLSDAQKHEKVAALCTTGAVAADPRALVKEKLTAWLRANHDVQETADFIVNRHPEANGVPEYFSATASARWGN